MTGAGISRKEPPGLRDPGKIRGEIAGLKSRIADTLIYLRQISTTAVKTTTKAVCRSGTELITVQGLISKSRPELHYVEEFKAMNQGPCRILSVKYYQRGNIDKVGVK